MVEEAQGLKASANALFEKGQYDDAILGYAEVLNCLPPRLEVRRGSEEEEVEDAQIAEDENVGRATAQGAKGKARHVDEDEDVKEARKLRAIVYANLAACHAKLKQHKETVVACNEALTDDPTYVKALHRRAQANEELASWSSLTSALEGEQYRRMLTSCKGIDDNFALLCPRLQDDPVTAAPFVDGCLTANCHAPATGTDR